MNRKLKENVEEHKTYSTITVISLCTAFTFSEEINNRKLKMMARIFFIIYMFATQFIQIQAQFGINKPNNNDEEIPNPIQNSNNGMVMNMDMQNELDFENDPELQAAIQMFADMPPQEMMETIQELKEMFGDDPETMKEIEEIMEEISKMDASGIEQNMKEIMDEEMVAMAMADTLELLQNADEHDWDRILEHKDAILEVVISSGAMSDEEIVLFRDDPDAWEEELMLIWDELKKQSEDAVNDEL